MSAAQDTPTATQTSTRVVMLGTGNPRPDPERSGPATAIVVNGTPYLVDFGPGVIRRASAAYQQGVTALGYGGVNIKTVFLTHLHSDHTADLPDLFTTTWIMGRSKPLELYGPQGIAEMATGVKQFLAEDIHIRRDLTEKLPAAGAEINPHVVRPGVVYDDGEVKVIAFAVDHAPVEPAFGYRFESHGRVIVFSGDYHPNDSTVPAVKGADVLVSEVYLPEYFQRNPATAATLSRYHCTPEQAAELARKAGVKKLVFTHIIPPEESDEIVRRAKKIFDGEVVAGKDLTNF